MRLEGPTIGWSRAAVRAQAANGRDSKLNRRSNRLPRGNAAGKRVVRLAIMRAHEKADLGVSEKCNTDKDSAAQLCAELA